MVPMSAAAENSIRAQFQPEVDEFIDDLTTFATGSYLQDEDKDLWEEPFDPAVLPDLKRILEMFLDALDVLGDDVTQDQAFAHANDVLKNAVGGIAEIINDYGFVNVDFEDVRTVMGEPGKAMMGTATASGPDRARIAAEQAVACPLLEGIDLSGAKGVLVLVTASKGSLKLNESREAMNTIRAYASPEAHVIYGAAYDDSLGDDIRVTVVATGLSRANARRQPISVVQGGLRILDKVEALHGGSLVTRPVLRATDVPRLAWRALRM